MRVRALAIVAVALAGAVGTGFAEARDNVQFSVTIGQPGYIGWSQPAPVFYGHQPLRIDRDGDGIPNRYDRHYTPVWDRDGDGVPNRYDRRYTPAWDRDGDGIPNRYDRRYTPAWDRDGDGIPNRYDRVDNRRHDRDRDGIPDRFDRHDGQRNDRDRWDDHRRGR